MAFKLGKSENFEFVGLSSALADHIKMVCETQDVLGQGYITTGSWNSQSDGKNS